jgi:hypothetical protein
MAGLMENFWNALTGPVGDAFRDYAYLLRDAVRGEPRRRRGDALDFFEHSEEYGLQLIDQDQLPFEAVIATSGAITTAPAVINGLPSNRIYEIHSYCGYSSDPQKVGLYASTMQFQVTLAKGPINWFNSPQSFGPLIGYNGSNPQIWYNGGVRYVPPNTAISAAFTTNPDTTVTWSSKVNEANQLGLVFYANVYVRTRQR